MLNDSALAIFQLAANDAARIGCAVTTLRETTVLDAGIEVRGSLEAGVILARLCLGDRGNVTICPADANSLVSSIAVLVRTDDPLRACLGAQYAGWPVQSDDFFAMGSGPMRMSRGREEMLKQLRLSESAERVLGVLESDKMPTESSIEMIAQQCGVPTAGVNLAVAPSTSIAGSIQVVARSIETAMHKLHELEFDVTAIVSATGHAPLPPPAKKGDTVGGIGRTNDAMLYGATVTLWVDHEDDAIDHVATQIPSSSSSDHGQPFANIFKQYDYDFYKVDPLLFSPAVVTLHNLRSGRTWSAGRIATDILRQSFLQ